MTPTLAAYLAGLFDGEGCINRKPNGATRLTVANTDRRVCDLFRAMFGGSVHLSGRTPGKMIPSSAGPRMAKRQCYQWEATGVAAARAKEAMEPYLRIKVITAVVGCGGRRFDG